uniref:Uncharacterized protein n=1 Tax=Cacopsylla melanoneura TaxID=428564 RepID=A0A8D8TC69_9HEMI
MFLYPICKRKKIHFEHNKIIINLLLGTYYPTIYSYLLLIYCTYSVPNLPILYLFTIRYNLYAGRSVYLDVFKLREIRSHLTWMRSELRLPHILSLGKGKGTFLFTYRVSHLFTYRVKDMVKYLGNY